jgi:hypothetical protein
VRSEARTGVLTVQNEDNIIAISVENGRIVGADALNETLEEGLGGVLVSEGLVTEAQFEAAAGRVGSGEGRIGDVLVDEALISREDYLAVLRRYTMALVQRVGEWQSGEFKFYVGSDVSYEEGFEPIRVKELVPAGLAGDVAPAETSSPGSSDKAGRDDAEVLAVPTEVDAAPEAALFEADFTTGTLEEQIDVALEEALELSPSQALLRRASAWLAEAPRWIASVAPALVVGVLATMVVWQPNSLVYPFFWLETERLELQKQRRASVYAKIDRAAKTFFLLDGRFPDDLHTLVARGLLAPDDIVGARGRILTYEPEDRGYVIRDVASDGTDPGVTRTEAIAGDFFLDPEFVIQAPDSGPTPLVLLD